MTAHEEARATTSLVRVYERTGFEGLNVQRPSGATSYRGPVPSACARRGAARDTARRRSGRRVWNCRVAKLIDSEGPERWRGKRVLEISAGGGAVVVCVL